MANSSSIAAYTFAADIYAPSCIVGALTSTDAYQGWALGEGITMGVEEDLNEIAFAFAFDRQDETSFDSDEFPKVVFHDQIEEDKPCACGLQLGEH